MRPATPSTRTALASSTAVALLTAVACVSAEPDGEVTHHHHTIDYIEFTVLDMAEAQRFYGEAFGWAFTDYGPEYAGIQRFGGGEVGGMAVGEVKTGGPLVILYSSDLEASVRAVRAAGGRIVVEPFEFPGGWRFHFEDPSGNELAVWAEPPGA
jgi:predicted enzyme related to lactoylglutathione lyase